MNLSFLCRVMVLLTVFLTGCSAHLTIGSDPDGAQIFNVKTGQPFGLAPVTLEYDLSRLGAPKDSRGCYLVEGVEARWISGASIRAPQLTLCGSPSASYRIVMQRPFDIPDVALDLNFEREVREVRARQALASSSGGTSTDGTTAMLNLLNAFLQGYSDGRQRALDRQRTRPDDWPVTCTSNSYGSRTVTTCTR